MTIFVRQLGRSKYQKTFYIINFKVKGKFYHIRSCVLLKLPYFSRGFCPWTWLYKEAGCPVLCAVSCPSALPFGGHRSLHRTDQEERRRDCELNTPVYLSSETCVFTDSSNFLFWLLRQVDVYEVNLSDDVQHQMHSIVQELGIQIPPPVSVGQKTCLTYEHYQVRISKKVCSFLASGPQQSSISGAREDGSVWALTKAEHGRSGAVVSSAGQLEPLDQLQHRRRAAGICESAVLWWTLLAQW